MMYGYARGFKINVHNTKAENCTHNSVVYTVFVGHRNL